MERRHALKILGASAFLFACERGGIQLDQKGVSSPERTLGEKAKEFALNTWVELLSTEREKTKIDDAGKLTTKIKMEILNSDWRTILVQAMNGKNSPPLKVKWAATKTLEWTTGGFVGIKWAGEAEFGGISIVQVPYDLNSVDKANGVEWSGDAGAEFSSRGRSIYSRTSSPVRDKVAFQRWISQEIPSGELPGFSNSRRDSWYTKLERKNGQWNKTPSNSNRVGELGTELELPTSVLYFCDSGIGCRGIPADIK